MTTESRTGGDVGIEVEFDVFSGRPNPRWALSTEAAERLRADLRERATVAPPPAPGLGYRGFVIRNLSGDRSIPLLVRVFQSVVMIPETDRGIAYQDSQGVEKVLQGQAERLGYGELIP